MQTKHTSGPWHTFRQGTKHFVSQAADEEFRFAHAVVFETNYHPDNIVAARIEAEANARLIAAAPDLLAALDKLLSATVDRTLAEGYEMDGAEYAARSAALAAIAKATGG